MCRSGETYWAGDERAGMIGRVRIMAIQGTSNSPVVSLTISTSEKVVTIMAIPDTGADTTVVGRKTLHALDIKVVD